MMIKLSFLLVLFLCAYDQNHDRNSNNQPKCLEFQKVIHPDGNKLTHSYMKAM